MGALHQHQKGARLASVPDSGRARAEASVARRRKGYGSMCEIKIELIESAHRALTDLAELIAPAARSILTSASENTQRVINHEIKHRLRERTRAMDALQRHRNEHGC